MEATVQVSKWGNSLAVRLPKALVDELGLKEGDELNVVAAKDGAIEVETREDQRRRALDRMAARTGRFLPTTNSIATRPTNGERLLRHQHSGLCPANGRKSRSGTRAVRRR